MCDGLGSKLKNVAYGVRFDAVSSLTWNQSSSFLGSLGVVLKGMALGEVADQTHARFSSNALTTIVLVVTGVLRRSSRNQLNNDRLARRDTVLLVSLPRATQLEVSSRIVILSISRQCFRAYL